jgi:hypothetical protein
MTLEKLVALLASFGVGVLADIRTLPRSRFPFAPARTSRSKSSQSLELEQGRAFIAKIIAVVVLDQ